MDFDDNQEPLKGYLPPQATRIWRHPSELSLSTTHNQTPTPATKHRYSLLGLGAILSVATLLALSVTIKSNSAETKTPEIFRLKPSLVASQITTESITTKSNPTEQALGHAQWMAFKLYERTAAGDYQHLSSATLLEGKLITSLSRLAGRTSVSIQTLQGWQDLALNAYDKTNDVALLGPTPELVIQTSTTVEGKLKRVKKTSCTAIVDQTCGVIIKSGQTANLSNGIKLFDLHTTSFVYKPYMAGTPLMDSAGQITGMIVDSTQYLAAAVPINLLRHSLSQLLDAEYQHPWIGIQVTDTHKPPTPVKVLNVDANGPSAGILKPNDLIMSVTACVPNSATQQIEITSSQHVAFVVRNCNPGTPLEIYVIRDQQPLTVQVLVNAKPAGRNFLSDQTTTPIATIVTTPEPAKASS